MIRYCVPTAISFITGKPYEEIEADFQTHFLGDQLVEGIFLGAAAKLLKLYGYELRSINNAKPVTAIVNCRMNHGTLLIHVRGHVGIIYDDLWWDNKFMQGIKIPKKLKPLGIYEVIKL